MCLSCLLAFTLLAHDETVLCSTLGTRVVVGTSSRRSSHPRVRFAHVNKYKGSLRPHMLKPTFQLSRSIVNFVFLCLLPLKPEGAAQVKPRELEPRFRFARWRHYSIICSCFVFVFSFFWLIWLYILVIWIGNIKKKKKKNYARLRKPIARRLPGGATYFPSSVYNLWRRFHLSSSLIHFFFIYIYIYIYIFFFFFPRFCLESSLRWARRFPTCYFMILGL